MVELKQAEAEFLKVGVLLEYLWQVDPSTHLVHSGFDLVSHPLKCPLNVVKAGEPIDVLEADEVIAIAEVVLFRLEYKVEETVVKLSKPVDHLGALVDDVLIEVLGLACEFSDDRKAF